MFMGPHTPEPCPYEGTRKVVVNDRANDICCLAHAQDWLRVFPDAQVFVPRNMTGERFSCKADWILPGLVPS